MISKRLVTWSQLQITFFFTGHRNYVNLLKNIRDFLTVNISYSNFSKQGYEEILNYHTKKSRKMPLIIQDQVVEASFWLVRFIVSLVQTAHVSVP